MRNINKAFDNLNNELPGPLPLLDKLVEKYEPEQPLKGVHALMFQHLLGIQYAQTQALIKLGLDPENIIWVDLPYTSNPFVRNALIDNLGIPPENFHRYSNSLLEPYALCQRARINRIVRRLMEHPPEKFIVLDDGAYFLESAMCFNQSMPNMAIIEQTTRGIIKIQKSAALQYEANKSPIINVAQCSAKSILEPPFIARAITRALTTKFKQLEFDLKEKKVLVLGYGNIGKHVAHFIHSDLEVTADSIFIYDKKFSDAETTVDDYPIWDKSDLESRFDLIVGCSGEASFTVNDFIYANDGALLVSCSSGQVEFSRKEFVELADMQKNDDILIVKSEFNEFDMHADIPIQFPERKVTMLNGSWPINFRGQVNCIPPEYIQSIACLMVEGAIQAVDLINSGQTGLIEFNQEYNDRLIEEFKEFLGAEQNFLNLAN